MENEFIKQSKTKVPMRTKWYSENKGKIREVCDLYGRERRELYHLILSRIGEKYNLEAANKIYQEELGYPPAYAIDVVGYFPELEVMANDIIRMLLVCAYKSMEEEEEEE